jgi:hypothetical protein
MKKEYLILIAIIIFASSYLLLHKENQNNYILPKIEKIDTSKITGIIIKREQETIKFIKKGDNWVLTDKEIPADKVSVQDMFDIFTTFQLTALVSEKNDLQRYELDENKGVHVKLLQNSNTVFELTIGKPAPSFNHTFVMIANDKNIYHASGSFRGDFNKPMDDFKKKEEPKDKSEDNSKEVKDKKEN